MINSASTHYSRAEPRPAYYQRATQSAPHRRLQLGQCPIGQYRTIDEYIGQYPIGDRTIRDRQLGQYPICEHIGQHHIRERQLAQHPVGEQLAQQPIRELQLG